MRINCQGGPRAIYSTLMLPSWNRVLYIHKDLLVNQSRNQVTADYLLKRSIDVSVLPLHCRGDDLSLYQLIWVLDTIAQQMGSDVTTSIHYLESQRVSGIGSTYEHILKAIEVNKIK